MLTAAKNDLAQLRSAQVTASSTRELRPAWSAPPASRLNSTRTASPCLSWDSSGLERFRYLCSSAFYEFRNRWAMTRKQWRTDWRKAAWLSDKCRYSCGMYFIQHAHLLYQQPALPAIQLQLT